MKYNSEQEVFDAVVKHAEQMTKPSITGEACKYRSEDGNKCLVGALIEDCDYIPDMDEPVYDAGTSVSSLIHRKLLPEYLCEYEELLTKCQSAHDSDRLSLNWKGYMIEGLKEVALNFNLQYNGVL